MCQDTSKPWSVLELPPQTSSQLPPPPPESRPHWRRAPPRSGPSAEQPACALPPSGLSAPDCPPRRGAAPPSPCSWGHATGMFSLTATCRVGRSKGWAKCKIKPNVPCSKARKTPPPPLLFYISLNLSWCFFLFLHCLTSRSFGHGDTHLWGGCRPHGTCSSTRTGVWAANTGPEAPSCPDPHGVGAGEKGSGGKTTGGGTGYKPMLQVPGTSLTKPKCRVNRCCI